MSREEDIELSNVQFGNERAMDEESHLANVERGGRNRRASRAALEAQVRNENLHVDHSREDEELTTANKDFWGRSFTIALLIGFWYIFSISITVYNKWMFKDETGTQNVFPFPLFTTCVHMIVQFLLASLVLYLIPRFRPNQSSYNLHMSTSQSESQPSRSLDPKKPVLTPWFYLTRIGPCGAATSLDIGLGNMSFKFITLTFYTMCKSSVLGFVLLFAFLFRLEKPSWTLMAIIATMTAGVLMMVAGETAFDARGFALVMSSSASSGFRWSLTQILLIRHPATSNPFSSIFFLAPVMFLTLFVLALPVEGLSDLRAAFYALAESYGFFLSIGILLFPGCLAFLMTASEFALLQRTSVVTLSICGIFKEVLTISTASIVFKDDLTPINVTGLLVTIATIAAYNYIKIMKMREESKADAHLVYQQEYTPVLSTDPDAERAAAGGYPDGSDNLMGSSLSVSTESSSQRQQNDSPTKISPTKSPDHLE